MEGKEEIGSLVTVKGDDAPQGFCVSARVSENPNPSQAGTPTMAAAPQVGMAFPKKRGRPRKYGPDGPAAKNALSPMPISASIPLSGEFSGWKQPRARSFQTVKKAQKMEFENLGDRHSGDRLAYLGGANFTPHVITVNTGEDVAMKILSISQQESRAICVLSASGSISNVTLRQPNSSGGTLTYEGRFEILSLTGSFMPTDNGIVKSRSGGMSVSLAGPDGRVLGGGLAGLLVAASPVQVVLGSFLQGHQQEQKPKKQRIEPTTPVIPAFVSPSPAQAQAPAKAPAQAQERGYGGHKVNFTSPPSFHTNNIPCMNSTQQDSRDLEHDHNISSPEGESDDDDDVESDEDDDNLEISG